MSGKQVDQIRWPIERLNPQSFIGTVASRDLPVGEIHVWACELAVSHELLRLCGEWLSPAEQERAMRFRFDTDRERFVLAHGWLRYRLSRYCGIPPHALELDATPEGKPFLVNPNGQMDPVRFSLSHSRGYALLAVAREMDVGADVEMVREDIELLKLAERFFSPAEHRAISAGEGTAQHEAFFRYWVGKESVLKALGTGLRLPLNHCRIVFGGQDTASVEWQDPSDGRGNWTLRYLPFGAGWTGAVAAEGRDWRIRLCGRESSPSD